MRWHTACGWSAGHPRSTVVYRPAQPARGVNGHGEVIGRIRSKPALDAPDLQIQTTDVPYHAPPLPPSHSGRPGLQHRLLRDARYRDRQHQRHRHGIAERAAALIWA